MTGISNGRDTSALSQLDMANLNNRQQAACNREKTLCKWTWLT